MLNCSRTIVSEDGFLLLYTTKKSHQTHLGFVYVLESCKDIKIDSFSLCAREYMYVSVCMYEITSHVVWDVLSMLCEAIFVMGHKMILSLPTVVHTII